MGDSAGAAMGQVFRAEYRRTYPLSEGIPQFVIKCKLNDHINLAWKATLAKQFWGEPTDNLSEWKELWLEEYYR